MMDNPTVLAGVISVVGSLFVWLLTRLAARWALKKVDRAKVYKTDLEFATEIRDELRREVGAMKKAAERASDREQTFQRKLDECEEKSNYQGGVISTLRELCKHQLTQISALSREQGALQTEVSTLRDNLEAYRRTRGSRATDAPSGEDAS